MLPTSILQGVEQHPYYKTYTDFQQPYQFMKPHPIDSTTQSTQLGAFDYNNKYRYAAGYASGERYNSFFSDHSINFMSNMITAKLHGVHPEGKNIIVPRATILSVADSVFQATPKDAQTLQMMVINFIVDQIKTEFNTIERNNAYSIWVQKYDAASGLKQFDDVKLNRKGRTHYFQMRY